MVRFHQRWNRCLITRNRSPEDFTCHDVVIHKDHSLKSLYSSLLERVTFLYTTWWLVRFKFPLLRVTFGSNPSSWRLEFLLTSSSNILSGSGRITSSEPILPSWFQPGLHVILQNKRRVSFKRSSRRFCAWNMYSGYNMIVCTSLYLLQLYWFTDLLIHRVSRAWLQKFENYIYRIRISLVLSAATVDLSISIHILNMCLQVNNYFLV